MKPPFVSFILLSYNQEASVVSAVLAAIRQDYENLEIIIRDDHSTDDTYRLILETCSNEGHGRRIKTRQSPANLGLVGNLASALSEASGQLAVLAAADDVSHPARATKVTRAWMEAGMPQPALIYSDVTPVDKSGSALELWSERVVRPPFQLADLAKGNSGPIGASSAITPGLIDHPQPVDPEVLHEDRVFPFRAAALGGEILFVDEKLVDYQVEGGISRRQPASRWDYLTSYANQYYSRVLPDARQRLSDAMMADAPKDVVRLCNQVLKEQEAFLDMSDGRHIVSKGLKAAIAGARWSVIAGRLARFFLARTVG